MSASYALSIKQNFNGNELSAVLTTTDASGLQGVAAKFFIEAYTSIGNRISQAMSGDTTEAKQITISLGDAFTTGTAYTVRSIGMDASGAPVSNETVTETVTFYDTPGAITLETSSSASQVTATVDMSGADVSGDPIAYFLVQVVNTDLSSNVTTGFGKVDRTSGATSQNVIDASNNFAGVSFSTGDSVKVTVTPFGTVAGAGSEVSSTTQLSAVPNNFALTVIQPLSSGPSVPSFSLAAVDTNPIDGEPISALTLTITQTDVSDQVINLYSSGNWEKDASNALAALTIEDGSGSIVLTAGNEIELTFLATNGQGAQESSQTTFTYNGAADTSSFTAQSEVTFTNLVTPANLADAVISRDIVNDNEITVNLNNSSALTGSALTDLYNANGTTVALTLNPVDASGAVINSQSATLTALDQDISFNLGTNSGSKWDSIALLLTATSTYDAQANSSIDASSSSINLINAILTMSVAGTQPAKGSTAVSGVLTVSDETNNTPSFVSGTATLFLNKNNTGNDLDLSSLLANNDLKVDTQTISSLDASNQAVITFTGLNSDHDGHGLYISVAATQSTTKSDTHNFVTATSENAEVYKFQSPELTWSGTGSGNATVTANGNQITTAVDFDLSSGTSALDIIYNDGANDEGEVSNNDGFNVKFTDPTNNNNTSDITIDISGISLGAETLLVFTQQQYVSGQGEYLVSGQADLSA